MHAAIPVHGCSCKSHAGCRDCSIEASCRVAVILINTLPSLVLLPCPAFPSTTPFKRSLSLGHYTWQDAAAAAEAWQQLPALSSLCINKGQANIKPDVLPHLGRATNLTCLWLWAEDYQLADEAGGLAAALQRLPKLQRLWLCAEPADEEEAAACNPDGMKALATAVAGLPSLRQLTASYLPWDAAARRLEAATQPTQLRLVGDVSGVALAGIACCLTQLRSLGIYKNGCLSNKLLVMVSKQLTQLTQLLVVQCSSVSEEGVEVLTELQQLQQLECHWPSLLC